MIYRRNSFERGHSQHGWLNSYHTFSFADYYDHNHMGFGPLRVINEDRIAAGSGFGTHAHRDMEIISYVISGALAHKDDMGNGSVILPGDIQKMSAGTGVKHSEFNHAQETTHFLQIWIMPNEQNVAPDYQQKSIPLEDRRGKLALLAGPCDSGAPVTMHQDARMYAGMFSAQEKHECILSTERLYYIHLVRGQLTVNGELLEAGDALKLLDESTLLIEHGDSADVIVFDMTR